MQRLQMGKTSLLSWSQFMSLFLTDGKKAHEFLSIHTHARTQCLVERISFCNPLIYAINVHVVVV